MHNALRKFDTILHITLALSISSLLYSQHFSISSEFNAFKGERERNQI